jgi:alpha-glucosidase
MRWLDGPHEAEGFLCFAREPGFVFAANLGPAAAPLPPHREILLASEPGAVGPDGNLRVDTAVWLSA